MLQKQYTTDKYEFNLSIYMRSGKVGPPGDGWFPVEMVGSGNEACAYAFVLWARKKVSK